MAEAAIETDLSTRGGMNMIKYSYQATLESLQPSARESVEQIALAFC